MGREEGRGRVLIVDDEKAALQTLAALLEDEFEVDSATTIGGARELLSERPFHVAVCDYQLAGGTGFDVLSFARKVQPGLIGMLWTGRAELAGVRARGMDARVIPKSADPNLLLMAVRQAVQLSLLRLSVGALSR